MTTGFQQLALTVATVFFDSLWQGALIAGAAWLGLRCFPRLGAATRYAIWFCTLLAIALTPLLTVAAGGHDLAARDAFSSPTIVRQHLAREVRTTQPVVSGPALRTSAPVRARADGLAPAAGTGSAAARAGGAGPVRFEIATGVALLVAFAWLVAACVRGVLLALDLRDITVVRRRARVWSSAYAYPVLQSERVSVPVAIGFARPAVVLPSDLVDRLGADALHAIVIHELAHLRRYDLWTNAIARVAHAVLVLNPAAWFVMGRLSVEREIACDDWVIERTGSGEAFARTLLALATAMPRRVPIAVPSAFGAQHAIVARIERLLDARPRRLDLSPIAFGGALMALALIALVIGSVSPVLAFASVADAPAPAPAAVVAAAGGCAVPNRGLAFSFEGRVVRGGAVRHISLPVPAVAGATEHYGVANVAVVDLSVDAAGKARKVVIVSAPPYPGMREHLTRGLLSRSYEPALRGCVPVATTMRAGLPVPKPEQHSGSVFVPVYANGWSAAHPSGCKVPTVTHARFRGGFVPGNAYTQMLPAFPEEMKDLGVDEKFRTVVRVHVDPSGAATDVSIVRSSGRAVFDDATVTALKGATYPLVATSCKPLPNEYVVTTTFETQALFGL